MLRWYANRDDRRRVMRQLNKGESLHDLRAYLMIANKGHVRRNRSEDLANQASCLNLMTNAVILWNTVYMAEGVAQFRREGYPIHDSDLARVWPTRYEHLNVYGRFHFDVEEAQQRKGLRPRCGEPAAGFLNNQNCSITIGNPPTGTVAGLNTISVPLLLAT